MRTGFWRMNRSSAEESPVGEAEKVLFTSQYQGKLHGEKVPCSLRLQRGGCCV